MTGLFKLAAIMITAAVVIGIVVVAISYWLFLRRIGDDVARLVATSVSPRVVVTDVMLAPLPSPAQRYFRYAGILGKPIPRIVRLTQKGRIRSSAASGWMSFEADETYATTSPAFVWRAFLPSPVMPVALGRDEYLEGHGSILIKLLAALPMADEHGDELAAAGLMRYLNETMWFPAALLGPSVTITPIDGGSFGVRLSDRGMAADAVLFVDSDGRLTNFRAQRLSTSTHALEAWETPITAYGTLNGLQLPTAGSAIWKLPDGDLDYIELEITGLSYEN
jgi:hypothetical protein